MGFASKCGSGLALVVLLLGRMAVAGTAGMESPEIEVLVYDNGAMTPSALEGAESEAARIFRKAGVEVTWVNCSSRSAVPEEACHVVPDASQLVLHIVPGGRTSTDSVFGMAFLGQDGIGKYSDIFLDRVQAAQRRFGVDVSRLVGTVAAHELGHLLLGSHAHSFLGIMAPQWETESLRQMNMGELLFTRDQASRMRARIQREAGRRDGVRLVRSSEKGAE